MLNKYLRKFIVYYILLLEFFEFVEALRNLIMYYVTLCVYITIVQYATLDGAMHQKIITLYASISGASRQRNALR